MKTNNHPQSGLFARRHLGRAAVTSMAIFVAVAPLRWACVQAESDPPEPTQTTQATPSEGTDSGASGSPLKSALRLDTQAADSALAALPVTKPASMAGYAREEQFPHWRSAKQSGWGIKQNGCDVRQATLIRDGKNVKVGDNCKVLSGTWVDPYGGTVMTDPDDIDIDHIVPLGNAYRAGANGWTKKQGITYANAPDITVVSLSSLNSAKGDQGPEAWKPPNREAWCVYALRWVQAKSKYRLRLNSLAEKNALTMMLNTCKEGS